MTQRIIYSSDEGIVSIVAPAPEWLAVEGNTIERLAQKVVPLGKPYKIVATADIPTDRTFRDAWEVDPTILTDGVGAFTEVTK